MAFSETTDEEKISSSYMKLVHLHMAVGSHLDIECFRRILQKEGYNNYQLPTSSYNTIDDVNLHLLHSVYRYSLFDKFELLIDQGVDFTLKNCDGHTIVHRAVYEYFNDFKPSIRFENPYVDLILSAHVKFKNTSNPRCNNGISHFHVACMTNHVGAVEFFLDRGIPVDEIVHKNSPILAGFTPLHFAVRYSCFEAAQILMKYGANLYVTNAARLSPYNLLLKRRIKEIELIKDSTSIRMIKFLLKQDERFTDDFGLSKLHVACAINDASMVENILSNRQNLDVNHAVNMDSPIYPGYTALHFAATSDISIVKLLSRKQADIEAKDANNVTPFDLLLKNRKVKDIHYIISTQPKWKDIRLSDGKSLLLDLVFAMTSNNEFSKFLDNFKSFADLIVPTKSPLWPGYTILHLTVIFCENDKDEGYYFEGSKDTRKVEECLIRGADITKTDVNNKTALHLAFYSRKVWTVRTLLKHHLTIHNPFDNNNLSHFHIACASKDEISVQRFLNGGCIDVNIPINCTIRCRVFYSDANTRQLFLTPGSTALHINVACGNIQITRMLFDNGANIYAKDCNGCTPIHRLFTSGIVYFDNGIDDLLLNLDNLQDCIANFGLSYLHVACHLDKLSAVEKLLDSGADVNAVIKYEKTKEFLEYEDFYFDHCGDPSKKPLSFLSQYSGFTPLDISIKKSNIDIQILLMKKGASISAENSLENMLRYLSTNWNEQLERLIGIPKLHIACRSKKIDLVKELLTQGDDVNMKCQIKPGNTPLHFAMMNVYTGEDEATELIELLLRNGADVTLRNDNGDTPLHLLEQKYNDNFVDCKTAHLLLNSIKDFKIDDVDPQGMSFFHFACLLKDVEMVEKFLENGIDVNQPVSYHVQRCSLCSPLHLVTHYRSGHSDDLTSQMRIIDLLLKNGADIHAVDAYGNTLLHCGNFGKSREKTFDIFIRNGLDVNAENILGETPLEALIKTENASWEEVQYLLKHGACLNSYNSITQESYITRMFDYGMEEKNALDNDVIRNLITSEYVTEIDCEGHSFLHNFVSMKTFYIKDYVELIGQLVKYGCNIDHQDKEGKTALHVATWFRNNRGVMALMKNGADVNIKDNNGRTAFAYSFESPHKSCSYDNHSDPDHVINVFAMHVYKMETCGLYISQDNRRFQADALEMYYLNEDVLKSFRQQLKKIRDIKIGLTALTLYDFIFEMDTEMIYPCMSHFKRLEIDQFFQSISQHNLYELDYLLKLKYERACERLQLINSAVEPFGIIIKNQLPELCCRIILSFLSTVDLENVIATEDL